MIEDVTERHRLQHRLRYQAIHDPLTGLPNRALFVERLDAGASPTRADGTARRAVLPGPGRLQGGQRQPRPPRRRPAAASRSPSGLRARCCRATGSWSPASAATSSWCWSRTPQPAPTVDRARRAACSPRCATPFQVGGHELAVTREHRRRRAAGRRQHHRRRAHARRRHHAVLGQGRGQGPLGDLRPGAQRQAEITRFTPRPRRCPPALERGEFFVEYQPLVSPRATTACAASRRWCAGGTRSSGLLGPDRFIALAEETGADRPARPLGAGAGLPAGPRLAGTSSATRRPFVSVNLAAAPAARPGRWSPRCAASCDRPACRRDRLQLELTERAVMRDEGAPLQGSAALRRHGRPHRHRRLRHRLLQPGLPAPTAGLRAEARRARSSGAATRPRRPGRRPRSSPPSSPSRTR